MIFQNLYRKAARKILPILAVGSIGLACDRDRLPFVPETNQENVQTISQSQGEFGQKIKPWLENAKQGKATIQELEEIIKNNPTESKSKSKSSAKLASAEERIKGDYEYDDYFGYYPKDGTWGTPDLCAMLDAWKGKIIISKEDSPYWDLNNDGLVMNPKNDLAANAGDILMLIMDILYDFKGYGQTDAEWSKYDFINPTVTSISLPETIAAGQSEITVNAVDDRPKNLRYKLEIENLSTGEKTNYENGYDKSSDRNKFNHNFNKGQYKVKATVFDKSEFDFDYSWNGANLKINYPLPGGNNSHSLEKIINVEVKYKVYGKVYGVKDTKYPIANAIIQIMDLNNNVVASDTSESDGSYKIYLNNKGLFDLVTRHQEHNTKFYPDMIDVNGNLVFNPHLLHNSIDQWFFYDVNKIWPPDNPSNPLATWNIPEGGYAEPTVALINPTDKDYEDIAIDIINNYIPKYSGGKLRPKYTHTVHDTTFIPFSASDTVTADFKVYWLPFEDMSGADGGADAYVNQNNQIYGGYALVANYLTWGRRYVLLNEITAGLCNLTDVDNKIHPEYTPSQFANWKDFSTSLTSYDDYWNKDITDSGIPMFLLPAGW